MARTPIRIGDNTIQVTISLGATIVSPDEDSRAFLNRADSALYEAKNGGRNQVKFSPAAHQQAVLPGGLITVAGSVGVRPH